MQEHIIVRGAREHNLKNIDVDLPRDSLVVITGLSGSGKSSLAFDTIYAEGQRRFMESLSAYARQFLGMMERPAVDFVDGLSPVISIDQKTTNRNPRSTVGTVTEITDFLRLLFARVATPYSYITGNKMEKQSTDQVIASVMSLPQGTKVYCMAPVVRARKGHYRELFEQMARQGFIKARVDGEMMDLENTISLDRYKTHNIDIVVDRFVISPSSEKRISDSVQMALQMADGNLILGIQKESDSQAGSSANSSSKTSAAESTGPLLEDRIFSKHLFDPESGLSYEDPAPNLFSFNSPNGACPSCNGLGYRYDVNPDLVIPNPDQSINDGGVRYLGKPRDIFAFKMLHAVLKAYEADFDTPIREYSAELMGALFEGGGERKFNVSYDFSGSDVVYRHTFEGLKGMIREAFEDSSSPNVRDKAKAYLSKMTCSACDGGRLKPEALSYKLDAHTIADLSRMDILNFRKAMSQLNLSERQRTIGHQVIKEIIDRADFLINVGLGYLSLDREAQSLSGGEAQRIRLATQIGTQLVGVLYVLDEPSIGLHQRDNIKLIRSLEQLRDLGNTVLVVEHDRETIEHADYVVDMGPGAGQFGGEIVTQGTPKELDRQSLTSRYLRDEEQIPFRESPREGNGTSIHLIGATGHNLRNVDLEIPLGRFICVTGVSGSGKSSLINQTLVPILSNHFYKSLEAPLPYQRIEGLEHIDKIISIDQSPIGRTPRSNPGTYTKLFDQIRTLYAELPEAKIRGYNQGRFSFNVKGGRCETCQGDGVRKIEMNFLPDVYVTCETCSGKRYNRETLEIYYNGKSINDVLEMTVSEALAFFDKVPSIRKKLETLDSVGLGYVRLGQSSTTLSGGEAQRIKLSRELAKTGTGNTLYVMDEPTTGLHFQDVRMLVDVIQQLVDKGNTVIVIEHNLDLIKAADWVIDVGPDGGAAGGQIIAQGTPLQLAELAGPTNSPQSAETDSVKTTKSATIDSAKSPHSATAEFLRQEFDRLSQRIKA